MTRTRGIYIVVRQIATDELRICRVADGYRPKPDPEYTYSEPFPSMTAANKAIARGDDHLRRQLYPQTAAGTHQ